MACYLEHTAFPVKDINWHIHFFRDILAMKVRKVAGPPDRPEQVWFWGGIQLKSDPNFSGPEGRLAHLGIMTDDLDATLDLVYEAGATELPQGRNWVQLPDGLAIEFLQAAQGSVEKALKVNPWQE